MKKPAREKEKVQGMEEIPENGKIITRDEKPLGFLVMGELNLFDTKKYVFYKRMKMVN